MQHRAKLQLRIGSVFTALLAMSMGMACSSSSPSTSKEDAATASSSSGKASSGTSASTSGEKSSGKSSASSGKASSGTSTGGSCTTPPASCSQIPYTACGMLDGACACWVSCMQEGLGSIDGSVGSEKWVCEGDSASPCSKDSNGNYTCGSCSD